MSKKKLSLTAVDERISLQGIQLLAHIGVYPREKRAPQPVSVDVALDAELVAAAKSDALAETADYGMLAQRVVDVAGEKHRHLIETLAYDIAAALLQTPRIRSARVTVHKPGAVSVARDTSVTIELRRA